MVDYRDFQEIAHSGGRISFDVVCDNEGQLFVSMGWTHDRPKPAAIVGLYADLGSGAVIADFCIGGMGQPFDPQPPLGSLPVMLGSDTHSRWGHSCPRCKGYFRSENHPAIHPLTCAYCGLRLPAHAFLSLAQRKYVAHIVEKVSECMGTLGRGEKREIVIDMDEAGDQASAGRKPDFYYSEQAQQTEFWCAKCGNYNDIRGRYAYCTLCGWRNNREDLKSALAGIRERLNAGQLSPASAVREAVSEFDACCRDYASQIRARIPMKPARRISLERAFHDIHGSAITAMKDIADVDLMRGFDTGDRAFLKLMMHRRHIHEHRGSVADEIYVTESGDQSANVGDLVRENQGNAHRLVGLLNRMVTNLEADFHEIFDPTEWPIRHFNDRREHVGRR